MFEGSPQTGSRAESAPHSLPSCLPLLLIPLAALLATLPLWIHGTSCGHDLPFHLESWLEAASDFRQGQLHPLWATNPAWNSGEPRFLFYPPLSWTLGALLTMLFPIATVPTIYTILALTAAGCAMYRLTSRFVAQGPALLGATLYLANPYMLFNALERFAAAELLAATWIPLLLLAMFRRRPSAVALAVPLALVWLTNAPAAVMGTYTVALLGLLRVAARWQQQGRETTPGEPTTTPLRLALTYAAGMALGLALPAFYLLPAAIERHFVQVDMAIIPNLRYQDNFLFARTDYIPHNIVTHTVSVLAVTLLLLTAMLVGALLLRPARPIEKGAPASPTAARFLPAALAVLTAAIAFLLVPASAPVWHYVPELAFLQFPWRLLTILSAVLCLAVAMVAAQFKRGERRWKVAWKLGVSVVGLACATALGFSGWHLYAQACEAGDRPAYAAELFRTHHGAAPTDEYTPVSGDNDALRPDDPPFWLANEANDPAPGTFPNPNETDPLYDKPLPVEHTVSTPAPHHLSFELTHPQVLVLNLRDFPSWDLTRTGSASSNTGPEHPAHLQRDDGLLAVQLPAGHSTMNIRWRRGPDAIAGMLISLLAMLVLLVLLFSGTASRRLNPDA